MRLVVMMYVRDLLSLQNTVIAAISCLGRHQKRSLRSVIIVTGNPSALGYVSGKSKEDKMRRNLLVALALIVAGLTAQTARAWGEYGHLTVCDLAYRNLTPTSRTAIQELLQSRTGGIVVAAREGFEGRRYTSFNVGCLEEDARPRRHPRDHFINVSRDTASIGDDNCPPTSGGSAAQCILSGIQRDRTTLADRSRSNQDRVMALMALGHWIGDIHQPLHVSFADDVGGNNLDISVRGRCGTSTYRPGNLHAVWDNCLLQAGLFERVRQRADFNPAWGERTITYRAVDTLMANTPLALEQSYVASQPHEWANESLQITRAGSVGYCVVQANRCEPPSGQAARVLIDSTYRQNHAAVAQERVRRAGFRLAHIINIALDPNYTGPTANGGQPL